MKSIDNTLSLNRVNRLKEQGYAAFSYDEIKELAFGIRFSNRLFGLIVAIGLFFPSSQLLFASALIAFGAVVLPNHPFDYLYNWFLADLLIKPKLPPRSKQMSFACLMATLWIVSILLLFQSGAMMAGVVLGIVLLGMILSASLTDFCIPSVLYNEIHAVIQVSVSSVKKVLQRKKIS